MTLGCPLLLQDKTGLLIGQNEFLDIYDRPPYVRVDTTLQTAARRITILVTANNSGRSRENGISICLEPSMEGTVKIGHNRDIDVRTWLRRSQNGGRHTREFHGSDGAWYRWSFRGEVSNAHEWMCVQLGSNLMVAHYDPRTDTMNTSHQISGNVLTVYENWQYFVLELIASLSIVRHMHAMGAGAGRR